MELIERDRFAELLENRFSQIGDEGHSVFVSGEAGMGKTSLVRAFCKKHREDCNIYQGTCDALFTPRPLAPLYDIVWQVNSSLWPGTHSIEERAELFTGFFRELSQQSRKILIVFEDVHWADEATLDFIKFFARRVSQLRCLFILTYRDDEIHTRHPLRNVLGQLPPDVFTQLILTPLSREAVAEMAAIKNYNGEDVYKISGGNPFYVNEILASYSLGVPDNIKNSILSVYNGAAEKTKQIWDLLSLIPDSFEIKYLEKFEPLYASAIENCLEKKILLINGGRIHFKHELYRRTIEAALSPLKRIMLNKRILDLLKEGFEESGEVERIVHHAKNANEYELVVEFAPKAGKQAAAVGAHQEASKLYLTAIEYYQGKDAPVLLRLYESYAYECYLTNQVQQAIIYTTRALQLWRQKNDVQQAGDSLRFLSRLWWFDGNRQKAEQYAKEAIDVFEREPASVAKARAYSNMSQLKMLADQVEPCIDWGNKAIELAKELNNEEIRCHALNNVGTVKRTIPALDHQGKMQLQESLEMALANGYHEHAARAFTNLASTGVKTKDYAGAAKMLEEGVQYCEQNDLDSWVSYMLSWKARLKLETGHWEEAYHISENLLKNSGQAQINQIGALTIMGTILLRRGDETALDLLLQAKTKAFETLELQRLAPVLVALLEYEWLKGSKLIDDSSLQQVRELAVQSDCIHDLNDLAFWLHKARNEALPLTEYLETYQAGSVAAAHKAAARWQQLGNPYAYALLLFEGDADDKRKAILQVQELGATAVYERMKQEMRTDGIRSIPRGLRKSTRANAAFLTGRELDVLQLLREGLHNKEIAGRLFISAKTVDHHISSILFKLDVNSRARAVSEALRQEIIK